MKKRVKKLVLSRETVRNLENAVMARVRGGDVEGASEDQASCPDASCFPYRCLNQPASKFC